MSTTCTVPRCGRTDTRPYLNGAKCPVHEPVVPIPPPHGLVPLAIASAERPVELRPARPRRRR